MAILDKIEIKIHKLLLLFREIPTQRKEELKKLSEYIYKQLKKDDLVNLIFICTHNSRRSQMCQIWAQTAAEYFDVPNVFCYSGGTEETSFNKRAVKAVDEAGFIVEKKKSKTKNPFYSVGYSDENDPLICFSKVYDHNSNPKENFAAIMTCSNADENCPVVSGADKRFSIPYEDPKKFDVKRIAFQKYQEKFDEIGQEMLYVFSLIAKKNDYSCI